MPPRRSRIRAINASVRTLWAALGRLRMPLSALVLVLLIGTLLFWYTRHQPSPVHSFVYTLNLVTLQVGPTDLPKIARAATRIAWLDVWRVAGAGRRRGKSD